MANPLILKLQHFAPLDRADHEALEMLTAKSRRRIAAHRDIVEESSNSDTAKFVMEGWACRYKTLADGRRQIITLLLPGDCFDLTAWIMQATDQAIGTLTEVVFTRTSWHAVEEVCTSNPRIREAFVWDGLVNSTVQREWAVSLGRRTALERVSHLFCELFHRLRQVDLTEGMAFKMPLTQSDLADTMGISTVHVNRTVQELRSRGLINWRSGKISINDLESLSELAMFNPSYLHIASHADLVK